MDRGHNEGVALFLIHQAWEHDRHRHDRKFDVTPWTIIRNSCDREVTILHLLCKPCLVDLNEGPEILELEDTPGLAIDLFVGENDGDLISHRVRLPAFASNGSDGYFAWLNRGNATRYLTGGSERSTGGWFVCGDVLRE